MKLNKINKKIFLVIIIFLLAIFLRFYKLTSNPPSLYWEEAALGYDAYSILKTGKDFHGNSFPLVAFESFGDWKPSLYFYALVPSIAVFGLNEFSVRFPSAFFGSLTVLLAYFLTKELFVNHKKSTFPAEILGLVTSFLLAINPWHLQFSRAGFEANLAVFLIVLGVYLFLKAVKFNIWFLILSSLSFSLSLYAYHAARLFTPLLTLSLGLIFIKKLWKEKKIVLVSLTLALFLISPIIKEFKNPAVKSRFQQTSAFSVLEPVLESNEKIREDKNTIWARIIHHRFWGYGKIYLNHYFDHFRPEFLFLKGDINPRHSTREVGLIYLIEVPFLLAGIYFVFHKKQWELLPIIFWLILAPVPAGLTKATPHALRFLISIPTLQILTAYGIVNLFLFIKKKFKQQAVFIVLLAIFYLFFFGQHLHFYYQHYPFLYSQHWQYGYKEMVNYVLENEDKYDKIYITREQGRPSIYYFFYGQIDPRKTQAQDKEIIKDQGEFLKFDKIRFISPEEEQVEDKSLIVAGPSSQYGFKKCKEIRFLNGELAFKIYEN